MFSQRFLARLDISRRGLPHVFKYAWLVANSLSLTTGSAYTTQHVRVVAVALLPLALADHARECLGPSCL
jgi:hypothetical protein